MTHPAADPPDPTPYDDPDGWGFCKFCARDVACGIDDGGILLEHHNNVFIGGKQPCPGTGRVAFDHPGPTAEPLKIVCLVRTLGQLNARQRAQKQRAERRERLARMAKLPDWQGTLEGFVDGAD